MSTWKLTGLILLISAFLIGLIILLDQIDAAEHKKTMTEKQAKQINLQKHQTREVIAWRNRIQALGEQTNDLQLVRVQNNCLEAVDFAVRYQDLNGEWVTQGWWSVAKGREKELAEIKSRNSHILFHVRHRYWKKPVEIKQLQIVSQDFIHLDNFQLVGSHETMVPFGIWDLRDGPIRIECQ